MSARYHAGAAQGAGGEPAEAIPVLPWSDLGALAPTRHRNMEKGNKVQKDPAVSSDSPPSSSTGRRPKAKTNIPDVRVILVRIALHSQLPCPARPWRLTHRRRQGAVWSHFCRLDVHLTPTDKLEMQGCSQVQQDRRLVLPPCLHVSSSPRMCVGACELDCQSYAFVIWMSIGVRHFLHETYMTLAHSSFVALSSFLQEPNRTIFPDG